jgi:hypothetical protein
MAAIKAKNTKPEIPVRKFLYASGDHDKNVLPNTI